MAEMELYQRAAIASREGRRAEARDLLLRAASAGHADSYYTLATMDLQGVETAKDPAAACLRLEKGVARGSNVSRRLLATLTALGCGRTADWPAAVSLLIDAAEAGDRVAQRETGLLVEMASRGHVASHALLLSAAKSGDALAAVALLRRSAAAPVGLSETECSAWRAHLNKVGHPLAHRLERLAGGGMAGAIEWAAVREVLSARPAVPERDAKPLTRAKPAVSAVEDFATAELCDYIIGKSAPMLHPSAVIDESTGKTQQHPVRTSFNATLWPLDQDLVVHVLNERMAALAGLPGEQGEMLSVLCYRPGQQYRPHFDFLSEGASDQRELARAGQRVATVLLYLNDDYAGGETHFLDNGLKVKGAAGSAVLFWNTDASGAPDRTTRHAGLAVEQGVKWLGSKWFRARRFDPLGA